MPPCDRRRSAVEEEPRNRCTMYLSALRLVLVALSLTQELPDRETPQSGLWARPYQKEGTIPAGTTLAVRAWDPKLSRFTDGRKRPSGGDHWEHDRTGTAIRAVVEAARKPRLVPRPKAQVRRRAGASSEWRSSPCKSSYGPIVGTGRSHAAQEGQPV